MNKLVLLLFTTIVLCQLNGVKSKAYFDKNQINDEFKKLMEEREIERAKKLEAKNILTIDGDSYENMVIQNSMKEFSSNIQKENEKNDKNPVAFGYISLFSSILYVIYQIVKRCIINSNDEAE